MRQILTANTNLRERIVLDGVEERGDVLSDGAVEGEEGLEDGRQSRAELLPIKT